MLPMKNILVPVVPSRRCAWAARYAESLSKIFQAQLILLSVGQEDSAATIEDFATKETGVNAHQIIVAEGDPAERIIEFAGKYQADLIVMPTYRVRFRPFLLGSVTAKVLHDVERPVLTGVHHDTYPLNPPDRFQNAVCALDTSPGCVPLLRWARSLTQALHMRLSLVHALPAVDETSDNRGEIAVRKYLLQQAEEEFAKFFRNEAEGVSVSLRGGEIATVVREEALATHADLVIVGRGHIDRTLGRLRTHVYSIIRSSPCPVISV